MIVMRTESAKQGLEDLCKYINTIQDTNKMVMIEIGAFHGDSTVIFAKYFKKVYTVDPWENGLGDITNSVDMEETYNIFKDNISCFDNIIPIRGYSVDVSSQFGDGAFDFVYIDGMHDYKNVKQDIVAWKDKAVNFIGGHDYRSKFQGVVNAVNETLGKPEKTFKDSSWITKK